jgi:hypothetical protein
MAFDLSALSSTSLQVDSDEDYFEYAPHPVVRQRGRSLPPELLYTTILLHRSGLATTDMSDLDSRHKSLCVHEAFVHGRG